MSTTKVSAFAKRRRLDDGTIVKAVEPVTHAGSVIKPAAIQKRHNTRKSVQISNVTKSIVKPLAYDDVEESIAENSFEPLVEAQIVQFSGIREIVKNGKNSVLVRLSKGQQCSISGIARIWVRDGSVNVCGAILGDSIETHTIFAFGSADHTSITALSNIAEFELESMHTTVPHLPSALNVPGRQKFPPGDPSFHIADLDEDVVDQSQQVNPRPKPCFTPQERLLSVLKRSGISTQPPGSTGCHILLCGKNSSATAQTSTHLINSLISDLRKRDVDGEVAFLDLDPSAPAFTLPGTVSLMRFRDFVLGPTHTHPVSHGQGLGNRLVASFFVGAVEQDDEGPSLQIMEKLISSDPAIKGIPLIVRLGSWFSTISANSMAHLKKTLSPTLILSVDRKKSSPLYEAAFAFADTDVPLEHLPDYSHGSMSSLMEHRNSLKSHFMLCDYANGTPTWHSSLSTVINSKQLVIGTKGGETDFSFLLVSGSMIRPQDIQNILVGSIITIVAAATEGSERSRPDLAASIASFDQKSQLVHLGIGYVNAFDDTAKTLSMITTVGIMVLQDHWRRGLSIGIVLERPGADGIMSRYMLRE